MAENAEMDSLYRKITKDHDDLAKVTKEAKAEFGASEREYIKLQENHKHIKEKIKKQKKGIEKVRSHFLFHLNRKTIQLINLGHCRNEGTQQRLSNKQS
jgi:hypothetical protein